MTDQYPYCNAPGEEPSGPIYPRPLAKTCGPTPTIERVIRVTADVYGLSFQDLVGRDRHKIFAEARHVAAYVARILLKPAASFPVIARELGNRDHTTVMSSCRRIELACSAVGRSQNPRILRQVRAVFDALGYPAPPDFAPETKQREAV